MVTSLKRYSSVDDLANKKSHLPETKTDKLGTQ